MLRRLLISASAAIVAPFALLGLIVIALLQAPGAARRRRRRVRPRLVYGSTPIISIKYMREAMSARGYEARTLVYELASINDRSDFDHHLADLPGGGAGAPMPLRALHRLFGRYLAFAWALTRFDVFHFFFDGGFLAGTPFRFFEIQLVHLAGKRVIAMPYGGDVYVPSHTRSLQWRQAYVADYPNVRLDEPETLRRIHYFCRRADFVVACLTHLETLPRWDLLTTHYYPIDTEGWSVVPEPNPGRANRPLTVFHSANHRQLKGTRFLIEACEQLRTEGIDVRLVLAENLPNRDVREALADSDIVAEQFLYGYALAAMEGMSLGKPVISNLSDPDYYDVFRCNTGLDECPIVSASPAELPDKLRNLVKDSALRAELGRAGRRYVLRHHSYETVGRMWEVIYGAVWLGDPMPVQAWHPDAAEEHAPAWTGGS
jgi:glycosyltransferase involved in cell wall biosynthesis